MLIAGGVFGVALAAIVLSVIWPHGRPVFKRYCAPGDRGYQEGRWRSGTFNARARCEEPEAVEEPEPAEMTPPEAGTAAAPDEDNETEELVEQPVDATAAVESAPTVDVPKKADGPCHCGRHPARRGPCPKTRR